MSLYSLQTQGRLEEFLRQEWLLTNGLGGFAMGTPVGCNTRRYHGLLVAATNPPVGRVVTLNRVAETLLLDHQPQNRLELAVSQFDHHFHPHGYRYLQRFELGQTARWEYQVQDVRIVKELHLSWMRNVAGLRYTVVLDKKRPFELQLMPLVALRDFHALRHTDVERFGLTAGARQVSVKGAMWTVFLQTDGGEYQSYPQWWHRHSYAVESERGLDDTEELFTPGRFVLRGQSNQKEAQITLWTSLEEIPIPCWEDELKHRRTAIASAHQSDEDRPPAKHPPLARGGLARDR